MNPFLLVDDIYQVDIFTYSVRFSSMTFFSEGISNVYGSPIMTLAGAPLTTLSAMNNGAIHFPSRLSSLSIEMICFYVSSSIDSRTCQCQSISPTIYSSSWLFIIEWKQSCDNIIDNSKYKSIAIVTFKLISTSSTCTNRQSIYLSFSCIIISNR